MRVNGYLRGMVGAGVIVTCVSLTYMLVNRHRDAQYQKEGRVAMVNVGKIPGFVARITHLEMRFDSLATEVETHIETHP